MRYIKNDFLEKLLEQDVTKTIFDNIRNFMYCALLIAIGTQAVTAPTQVYGVFEVGVVISGGVLIVISLMLLTLNILDGIYKMSMLDIGKYAYPFIILVYVIVVLRVVLFVWGYRIQ